MQNNSLQDDNPATVNNCPHTTKKQTFCEDIIGFRMDVYPRCLDLYSISIYEQSEITLENLIKKIESSIHKCSTEKLSKVMNMSRSQIKTEYMKLEAIQHHIMKFIKHLKHAYYLCLYIPAL